MILKRAVLAVCFLILLTPAATAKDLILFAAASTVNVVNDVGAAWQKAGGGKIRPVFASSGALARQIEAGAPADLFLSANVAWINYLVESAAVRPDTRLTAFHNSLVLIAPADSTATTEIDPGTGTYAALSGNRRLAMGDPRHVPAGIYAHQALEKLGIWSATAPRAARLQNVRLALAIVERGEAPLGIVYRTDARDNPNVRIVEAFSPSLHEPIRYIAVATRSAAPEAIAFLGFLQSAQATGIFRRHGFITD